MRLVAYQEACDWLAFASCYFAAVFQNELMLKAEENRHVSLCLEDAMKETNELKSQVSWRTDADVNWPNIPCVFSDSVSFNFNFNFIDKKYFTFFKIKLKDHP